MTSSTDVAALTARVRALEDREAIKELDARYCRYLDEGQWHRLGECFTEDGVFDGLSRIEGRAAVEDLAPVSAGRYRDHLVRTGNGWRIREKQVRFLYWSPLVDGWDLHAFGFAPARVAATPQDTEP